MILFPCQSSNLETVACPVTTLRNLRGIVFSFSLFSLLLVRMEWRNPACYMLDQKPEVPSPPPLFSYLFLVVEHIKFLLQQHCYNLNVLPSHLLVEILTHKGDGIRCLNHENGPLVNGLVPHKRLQRDP